MNIKYKLLIVIFAILFTGTVMFFVGRSTIKTDTTIDHIQRPERPINPPDLSGNKPIITVPVDPDLPEHVINKQISSEPIPKYVTKTKFIYTDSLGYYKYVIDSLKHENRNLIALTKGKKSIIPDNVNIEKVYLDWISLVDVKDQVMFNNEYGKYTLSYITQFNRVKEFYNPKFTPIETVITETFEKKWIPFGYISGTTVGDLGGGVGTFYKDMGISGGIEYPAFNTNVDKKSLIGRVTLYKKF